MKTIKIFIASSSELKEDRDQFRLFISKENDRLHSQNIYLKLIQWENFLDSISDTRLQDEYNNAIRECDIVLCLFFTKVGMYTAEEFDTAYKVFKDTGKPKIWTYFKDGQISTGAITDEINTLLDFKSKIGEMGHFYTSYSNIDNLINQFRSQLDKYLPSILIEKPIRTKAGVNIQDQSDEAPPKHDFNKELTEKLISAIHPFNKKAAEFLRINPEWKDNEDLYPVAKRIIISGYVGISGVQLRKLMSIGEEPYSQAKLNRYVENCILSARRTLQLINYALLSELWEVKLEKQLPFSASQSAVFQKFFKSPAAHTLEESLEFLKALFEVYNENKLKFAFDFPDSFEKNLNSKSDFWSSVMALDILQKTDASEFNIEECTAAEMNTTTVLETLSFLAAYKMVSMKEIDYALNRHDDQGIYLHKYALLEGDKQLNSNSHGKVREEQSPVISYSVILCKRNLREHINLAPFIIDYNALGLTGGSKICVFNYCDVYEEDNLIFEFIEDNSPVILKKSKNPKPIDANSLVLNQWLADDNNRKDLNYDNMIWLFQQAQKAFLGMEEVNNEELF